MMIISNGSQNKKQKQKSTNTYRGIGYRIQDTVAHSRPIRTLQMWNFGWFSTSIIQIPVALSLFVLRKPAFVLHMTEFATYAAAVLAPMMRIFRMATVSITPFALITGHTMHFCAMRRCPEVSHFIEKISLPEYPNELQGSHEVLLFALYVW